MNNFLLTRRQIDESTKYLEDNNLITSGISAKNWEAVQVLPLLKDGNILDMGSSGGIILDNARVLKLKGSKAGIDLAYENDIQDIGGEIGLSIELFKGDLMRCPFETESFDTISCLSVVEHDVKYDKIAKEVGRLLRTNGNAYISFDYWTPKPATSKTKLYSLDWNILDKEDVIELVKQFSLNGLELTSEINWITQDAVINDKYCSPVQGVSYTFGILNFIKK